MRQADSYALVEQQEQQPRPDDKTPVVFKVAAEIIMPGIKAPLGPDHAAKAAALLV